MTAFSAEAARDFFVSRFAEPPASAAVGVYACDAGHGFVKDDFNWILTSARRARHRSGRLLGAATGFFRPLVSLSFAIDHALFDLRPLGYGLTNLGLLLACVGVLFLLLRASGVGEEVGRCGRAVVGAELSGHQHGGVVDQRSHRVAGDAVRRRRGGGVDRGSRALATVLAMAAMWSKEEAFALPAILTAWSAIDRPGGPMRLARRDMAALAGCCDQPRLARGPAPSRQDRRRAFYRYQFDLATLFDNVLSYGDRVGRRPSWPCCCSGWLPA